MSSSDVEVDRTSGEESGSREESSTSGSGSSHGSGSTLYTSDEVVESERSDSGEPVDVVTVSPAKQGASSSSGAGKAPRTVLHYKNIASTITPEEALEIKEKYHIPEGFEVRAPGDRERMIDLRSRSMAISVASLQSGFRFPIPREVTDILNSLGICPTQLLPNSISLILAFIVFMRCVGHPPSYPNFCTLFSCQPSSKSDALTATGYYYLTARPKMKIFDSPRSSHGKTWKYRWVFVRAPRDQDFDVKRHWEADKVQMNRSVLPPSWSEEELRRILAEGPQSTSFLCSEAVLVAAGLSSAIVDERIQLGRLSFSCSVCESIDRSNF